MNYRMWNFLRLHFLLDLDRLKKKKLIYVNRGLGLILVKILINAATDCWSSQPRMQQSLQRLHWLNETLTRTIPMLWVLCSVNSAVVCVKVHCDCYAQFDEFHAIKNRFDLNKSKFTTPPGPFRLTFYFIIFNDSALLAEKMFLFRSVLLFYSNFCIDNQNILLSRPGRGRSRRN